MSEAAKGLGVKPLSDSAYGYGRLLVFFETCTGTIMAYGTSGRTTLKRYTVTAYRGVSDSIREV